MKKMNIVSLLLGMVQTNCYLLQNQETKEVLIVDPADAAERIQQKLREMGGRAAAILLTHGHFDHILGTVAVQEKTGAPVYLCGEEKEFLTNPHLNLSAMMGLRIQPFSVKKWLEEGDTVAVGESVLKVLHTPGHTAGGCCYLGEEVLFTGDTLMAGSMGRTDFPTGSWSEISRSLQRLASLPGDRKVYSGHGPSTTLERERQQNPYMKGTGYDFMD